MRSHVYRTEAIVLRRSDYSEADRILTLYTPLYGKRRAIAKGVRKTTSRLGGYLELFTRVSLMLAEGRNLHIVTQAEIIARLDSDEAFAGYWHRPDADARALRDGWYFTGDMGYVDADGELHVAGRVDDMIISGGENIHPVEVEDALARHPGVRDVAVVGEPDERWGQRVVAHVVTAQGELDPDELDRFCREDGGLAAFKRPREYRFVESLPKIGPDRHLSGADIESIVLGAKRHALAAGRTSLEKDDLAGALTEFVPSAQGLEKEAQELAAVLECTQMSFLPTEWRAKVAQPGGRTAMQERLVAIRQLLKE